MIREKQRSTSDHEIDNHYIARSHRESALGDFPNSSLLFNGSFISEMEASKWLLNVPSRYRLWLDRSPPMKTPSGLAVDERPKMDDEVRERHVFALQSLLIFLHTEHLG